MVYCRAAPSGRPEPAAWRRRDRPLGVSLEAAVRVEDARPNRILRTELPIGRTQQREAPAFPVHGVLPGGERHVSPSIATFPYSEANQLQPTERACFAFEDHLRIGKLPCGSRLPVRNDLHGHRFACDLGHGDLQRTPWEPDRRCWLGSRGVDMTPANRVGTHGPGARAN